MSDNDRPKVLINAVCAYCPNEYFHESGGHYYVVEGGQKYDTGQCCPGCGTFLPATAVAIKRQVTKK